MHYSSYLRYSQCAQQNQVTVLTIIVNYNDSENTRYQRENIGRRIIGYKLKGEGFIMFKCVINYDGDVEAFHIHSWKHLNY